MFSVKLSMRGVNQWLQCTETWMMICLEYGTFGVWAWKYEFMNFQNKLNGCWRRRCARVWEQNSNSPSNQIAPHLPICCNFIFFSFLNQFIFLFFGSILLLACSFPSQGLSCSFFLVLHLLGDLGNLNCLWIMLSSQYFKNLIDGNSPLRLDLITLITRPLYFSTRDLNFLKFSNTSDFSFKMYTHVFLDKLTIKRMN